MIRFLFVCSCIFFIVICAFLAGIASSEFKHASYYKFRKLLYLVTNTEQAQSRGSFYYQEKLSLYQADPRNDYDIVFIGDSLTDGADWQSFFDHLSIANRGINGDTTQGIAQRLDSIVNTRAKHAFIMVGVNDVRRGFDVDTITTQYQAIIDTLIDAGMRIFIQSTILTDDVEVNEAIKRLNTQLEALARDDESVEFIHINPALTTGGALDGNYTFDGIHLNGKGYTQWQQVLAPTLAELKSRRR